jgi:hypothetical protein
MSTTYNDQMRAQCGRAHTEITPSDETVFDPPGVLMVTAAGAVTSVDAEGNEATYTITSVPFVVPCLVKQVLEETTATCVLIQ